jgi:phosphoadenosine phosphosulfate reductase
MHTKTEKMTLQSRIDRAIRLLRSVKVDGPIEVCYSGGKDSYVILELAKMAGINYRAIYKNTTIDPPGTIAHCKANGVEIMQPKMTFFQLIEKKGFPTRRARFCCEYLKEYKVLDNAIQGIRRCESTARAARYKEPIICRIYGKKENHVNVILPILEWSDKDVADFIEMRGIRCHPLYYDENGRFDITRRLGCMGCPLKSDKGLAEFKANPKLAKAWIMAGVKFWENRKSANPQFPDAYTAFVQNVFFDTYEDFHLAIGGMFGTVDCKQFLEDYFKIDL